MRVPTLLLWAVLVPCTAFAGGLSAEADGAEVVGVEWRWQRSQYNNDTEAVPTVPEHYTLTLKDDGTVHVRADCNVAGGSYTLEEHRLTVEVTHSTMAMCPPDSLNTVYLKDLAAVQSWMLHEGDLVLMLKYDTGTMRFTPRGR